VRPFLGQTNTVAADDWKGGDLADAEAGGVDDDIERVENVIRGVNTGLVNESNGTVGELDVRGGEGF
jgi:hypothetical protein